MHYIIHPYQGVELQGGLRLEFEQSIEQVQATIGEPKSIRVHESGVEFHYYSEFRIDFDDQKMVFIEVSNHGVDTEVLLNGNALMQRSYDAVTQYLEQIGGERWDEEDEDFLGIGVSIWRTSEDKDRPDTVAAYKRGYHKETPAEMKARIAKDVESRPHFTEEEMIEKLEALMGRTDDLTGSEYEGSEE